MKETIIGTCRFCGQTKSVTVPTGSTEQYADEVVSKNCFCIGAAKDRLEIEKIGNVNQIFGKECSEGFKPVDEDELSYIISSVKALVNETVSKVTMSLKSGGSCKLKYKDITCIEVLREEKHVARSSK